MVLARLVAFALVLLRLAQFTPGERMPRLGASLLRAASSRSTSARNAASGSVVPVSASSPSGVVSAMMRPARMSSSRSQRSASSMTWLDTMSVEPPSASARNRLHSSVAQHRVEADGGLVEHEQLRRSEHRDRERDAGLLAAAERADRLVGVAVEPHLADDPVDVGARRADEPREVAEVLTTVRSP